MITARVQAIRELVDPFDQTEDIINCIDFLAGEPGVDPDRIGLWGTSFEIYRKGRLQSIKMALEWFDKHL